MSFLYSLEAFKSKVNEYKSDGQFSKKDKWSYANLGNDEKL